MKKILFFIALLVLSAFLKAQTLNIEVSAGYNYDVLYNHFETQVHPHMSSTDLIKTEGVIDGSYLSIGIHKKIKNLVCGLNIATGRSLQKVSDELKLIKSPILQTFYLTGININYNLLKNNKKYNLYISPGVSIIWRYDEDFFYSEAIIVDYGYYKDYAVDFQPYTSINKSFNAQLTINLNRKISNNRYIGIYSSATHNFKLPQMLWVGINYTFSL